MPRQKILVVLFLVVAAAASGFALAYTHQKSKATTQVSQCSAELQSWWTHIQQDPNLSGFTNILKVYKVIYNQAYKDCLVATYMILPAPSSAGQDMEYLEIDSLSTRGVTYWFDTYPPMQVSEATKILDEQLAKLK